MEIIHPVIAKLISNLSCGKTANLHTQSDQQDAVTKIARVYELARNALEYRAEHLVRRAAIERILRRQIVFSHDSKKLGKTEVDHNWLLGLISAEIESSFNPNHDYHEFTKFAFNVLRKRIEIDDPDIDLMLYVAIDKIFSQSDEAGISYHLYQLNPQSNLDETYSAFKKVIDTKALNTLCVFVRKQMGPLMLIRDLYFAAPIEFEKSLCDQEVFTRKAILVLQDQLRLVKSRMNTATIRSLIYVFLTKMIIGVLLESPLELLIFGQTHYLTLIINMIVPVGVMWLIVSNIHLPKPKNQEQLLARATEIIFNYDTPANSWEKITTLNKSISSFKFSLFYFFYALLFLLVFYVIYSVLKFVGSSIISIGMFVFFLSVVTFFAYRIRQIALIYTYQPRNDTTSVGWDVFTLPMVAIGDLVSRGVSQLNFLTFVFDFILEAPFKLILGFLENWGRFLSSKRDEIVG
ncbi:MAG: hypothetical protein AAB550_02505 [Patescibacteria group bacterium]